MNFFLGIVNEKNLYATWDGENYIYTIDGEKIGVYNPKVTDDRILFLNNTKANELSAEAKDTIQSILNEADFEQMNEMANKYGSDNKKEEMVLALGWKDRNIKSITEVDLDEKVVSDDIDEKDKEKITKAKKEDKQEEKYQNVSDVNVKQEVYMNAMATDMKSIGQLLKEAGKMPNIEGKTFTKMGIVESSDFKNAKGKTNTTRFTLAAIASDGTIVPLDLEQDYQEGA